MSHDRNDAVAELAEKILETAKAAYDAAPKLILTGDPNPPPPLEWHVAFTAAQFAEVMLRLLALRKAMTDTIMANLDTLGDAKPKIMIPRQLAELLPRAAAEANRVLKAFNIELAQEI